MPPTAVTSVKRFHINHVATATRALIYLVTLTFDPLTLKLAVPFIARGVGNLPTNFGISRTFHSRLMSLSDAPRDIVTLRPCRLTLSVILVFMLHLCTKFDGRTDGETPKFAYIVECV